MPEAQAVHPAACTDRSGAGAVRLAARELVKEYGGAPVVRGVSFTLEPGEILGLLGPNGAGKTTIVGMLYGAVLKTSGSAHLEPGDIPADSREARFRLGIVTQEDNLDPDFSVRDNLRLFAHHYKLVGEAAGARVEHLLTLLGLQPHAGKKVEQLSGGLQRRVVLARALLPDPQIIFLDEPTTGFDPDARQEFWKFIAAFRTAGKSILLTTHYMDEAERLCDRLLLLQEGECVDQGAPADLIARIIGADVLEIEGLSAAEIRAAIDDPGARLLPFGDSMVLPAGGRGEELEAQLAAGRVFRRPANLEDVFLALTGVRLS